MRSAEEEREPDATPSPTRPRTGSSAPPPRQPSSNGIFVGLAVGIALLGATYWVMTSLHDWDRLQTCATSGRRDCGSGR